MPNKAWVDFNQIKEEVSFQSVLNHYGLDQEFKRRGDQLSGPCPFHGDPQKPKHFGIHLEKRKFQCFYCQTSGSSIIDFVSAIEGVQPRDAALLLQDWFSIRPREELRNQLEKKKSKNLRSTESTDSKKGKKTPEKEKPVNKPLSFSELNLNPNHPYLDNRGLTQETNAFFGLGYCSRGIMKGRIAIPIHNVKGELVAYAGRWAGDEEIPEGEGKYKIPAGFHKSYELYNLNRIKEETKRVILVEGYASVWWLHQNGFHNCVSCMGSSLSKLQMEYIVKRFVGLEVFFDGDRAGEEGAQKVVESLSKRIWIKNVTCPSGLQPDHIPFHELNKLLSA